MTDQEEGLPLQPEPEMPEGALTAEAEKAAEAKDESEAAAKAASILSMQLPVPEAGGKPAWVNVPEGFTFPRGKQVLFMKFKSAWTDAPWKGKTILDPATGANEIDANGKDVLYRQCVIWPINTADKKLALSRASRDPNRAADELTKQMVRVHDGLEADWAVVRANGVEMFWNELGERCRGLLTRVFTQLHVLDIDSTRDFLANCIEARATGG